MYKINWVEVSKKQIQELVEKNPELLQKDEWRYFFPNTGTWFYTMQSVGDIDHQGCTDSDHIINLGVYKTKEQAQKAVKKQQALVRVWKYVQENDIYTEDIEDSWQIMYSKRDNKVEVYFLGNTVQPGYLPRIKFWCYASSFLKDCRQDLDIIFDID